MAATSTARPASSPALSRSASLQQLGLQPHCDVTTAAIRAEESVWFQVSYIGSRSAFGVLPAGALEAKRVDTGRTLAEHMAECGADIDDVRAGKASLDASPSGHSSSCISSRPRN